MTVTKSVAAGTVLADTLGYMLESGWANVVTETRGDDGATSVTGRFVLYTGDLASVYPAVSGLSRGLVPGDLVGTWEVRVVYRSGTRTVLAHRRG